LQRYRLSFSRLTKNRFRWLIVILTAGYIILALRLFHLQVICAPRLKAKAESLIRTKINLPARRGTIYDRNFNKLAVTVDAYDIAVRPAVLGKDKVQVLTQLASLIGVDRYTILKKAENRKKPFYVARGVDIDVGDKVKKAKLPGVDVLRTMKRVYPYGQLAAHIIGFTDVDGRGIAGLEKVFDRELSGKDGYVIAEKDARGKIIAGSYRERVEPVHGKDIVLTIDITIQSAVENYLDKESFSKYHAAGATAIVMDPKTGEILALANYPTFDPNNVGAFPIENQRNRAVTDLYEPGSTLKTITACAALEEGVIDVNDTFPCNGSMTIGRRTIRCSIHPPFTHGHGNVNVAKVLCYSCNMGAAAIGFRLGAKRLYEYEEAFGLYEKPGSKLDGETCCRWHDTWRDWPDVRLANIAFGQGIVVTPLQLARAYCAVANGGLLMRPYLVKQILNQDGTVERTFHPRATRRVISERTARMVCEMLHGVVTDGTGKPARVEGYKVGGKTGSAQKAGPNGGYAPGKFVASFVGFLPVTDPRLVILVVVDEPKGTHFGATAAAPTFREIARKAMWYMKVPPDDEETFQAYKKASESRRSADSSLKVNFKNETVNSRR
jgi:stage V sporulation protein D (sporulation-specific penicillin-binding protein)